MRPAPVSVAWATSMLVILPRADASAREAFESPSARDAGRGRGFRKSRGEPTCSVLYVLTRSLALSRAGIDSISLRRAVGLKGFV